MQYTIAEQLILKHFPGTQHGRQWYVWLGVGLINMLGGEVFGHYLEIPERARIWLHPFRISVDEPLFRRNDPTHINSILIGMLRTSRKEEFDVFPDAEWTRGITAKANAVQRDYLVVFPPPEEPDR